MQVRGEDDLARLATSFNEMADSLQRQIRQLEDLSRVQRRFVSDVSHELRTPLTTVRMAADVLHEARADFDPAVARSAELLQTQLDRFEALLADLLEISRFDAGRRRARGRAGRPAAWSPSRSSRRWSRSPSGRAATWSSGAERAVRRRGRPPPDRADPAQPRRQRDRARRGPAVDVRVAADDARGRGRRPRPRRRAHARRGRAGVQPVLAGRPGAGPHHRRHRARACRSRSRTPTCTAAGCRPGASPATARSSGSPCRASRASSSSSSPIPLEPMDSARRRRPVAVGEPYRRVPSRRPGARVEVRSARRSTRRLARRAARACWLR